jgi:hypothetical protein
LNGRWVEASELGSLECTDETIVRVTGSKVDLTGRDCDDDEPYVYLEIELEGRILRFEKWDKAKNSLFYYDLELTKSGDLVGSITYDKGQEKETTYEVTWRRLRR